MTVAGPDPGAPSPSPSFAMSVDVEEYFQVWAFSDVIQRASWDGFALRAEKTTHKILDLFDAANARATFFMLGWLAERLPGLAREIMARGHEIASHGYEHIKVFDQSKEQFFDDVSRAKKILEDATGCEVLGYRAAGFSIDRRTPWAHEVLAAAGYAYSSSTHPIAHDHYGDPTGPQSPYAPIAGDPFIEAPVATATVLGRRWSAAGGGWFRAAPYGVSKALLERAARVQASPVIFYFHPWEIDPDQPRIKSATRKAKLRHYLNLSSMEAKLERLLDDFQWGTVGAAVTRNQARLAA
ncbi:MAG: XrtA system polysaccharide deacetylase [Pseudomonadota bacterium]